RIRKGQQDLMIEGVPKGALGGLRGDPRLAPQLFVDPINDVKYFTLSLKHAALRKLQVRQAIAMAVDKDRYVRTIDGLRVAAHRPGLGHPPDRGMGRHLLRAAGFWRGFAATFGGIDFTPFLERGQTVQQALGEIGIDVTYKPMPLKAYNSFNVTNPAGITDN